MDLPSPMTGYFFILMVIHMPGFGHATGDCAQDQEEEFIHQSAADSGCE